MSIADSEIELCRFIIKTHWHRRSGFSQGVRDIYLLSLSLTFNSSKFYMTLYVLGRYASPTGKLCTMYGENGDNASNEQYLWPVGSDIACEGPIVN